MAEALLYFLFFNFIEEKRMENILERIRELRNLGIAQEIPICENIAENIIREGLYNL